LLQFGDAGLVLVALLVGLEQRGCPLQERGLPEAQQVRAERVLAASLLKNPVEIGLHRNPI
jgi:hypothetical protein